MRWRHGNVVSGARWLAWRERKREREREKEREDEDKRKRMRRTGQR